MLSRPAPQPAAPDQAALPPLPHQHLAASPAAAVHEPRDPSSPGSGGAPPGSPADWAWAPGGVLDPSPAGSRVEAAPLHHLTAP